jgi:DNA-binding response OmpR family regulator
MLKDSQMRLLLVEDNARLRNVVGESLRTHGYLVDEVATGASFRSAAKVASYDLFLVDLGLPDEDGLEIIRELRIENCDVPVLVITARANIDARVDGLEGGADDYLVKPFHQAELLARIRAVLRRPRSIRASVLRAGGLWLNVENGEARVNDQLLDLRPRERRLLLLLMRRAGSTVARSAIESAVSDFERPLSPNAIEVLVFRLRKALDESQSGVTIETVRGVGYLLKDVQA